MGDELQLGGCGLRTVGAVNAGNLRDNLARLFHIDVVADVQVQAGQNVGVVERGTAHDGAGQLHGVHDGNGGDSAGASHLIGHVDERRAGPLGLKLVGDGPARTLRRIAKVLLLPQRIDLEHDAVGGHGQGVARLVPMVDEGIDLVERLEARHR